MAESKNKIILSSAEWDERRQKIRELIKEHMKTDDSVLKDKRKKTGIEGQLEESEEKLNELTEYGNDLITNIKVAGEVREFQRRNFEEARRKALLDDLNKESVEALAKFSSISDKWSELKNYKEPVVMFNKLEDQKQRIQEIMNSKDNLIKKCEEEINRVSDDYYAAQEKQAAEICVLVERIDSQIEIIKKAYKHQLDLLQDAIEEERLKMAKTESENWGKLFDALKAFEARKIQIEKEKEKNYADEIEKICREQQEITRATRIRLERDAEALQLELRNTQNNILMNTEKIDYNYQVLKKRNEENVVINNQQKRRLAKLKENITSLKTKIKIIEEKAHTSVTKMSSEVHKLYTNISHLEQKSLQFTQANENKYHNVWRINYQEAISLANRISEIDRLLHVQQLGVDWVPQNIEGIIHNFLGNEFPGEKIRRQESKQNISNMSDKSLSKQTAEIRLIRSIIKKISDRAGFLIEERLITILKPYTDEEKCLVRIDNIFHALNITDYTDIISLIDYFMPYAWCPNCSSDFCSAVNTNLINCDETTGMVFEGEKAKDSETSSTTREHDICSISSDDFDRNLTSVLKFKDKFIDKKEKTPEENKCTHHYLVIKPAFVLTALRNFTENYLNKDDDSRMGSIEKAIIRSSKTEGRLEQDSKEKCWPTFLKVMTKENQKLWKTLEHGLDHYLEVLKEREKLDMECELLRRQNTELRHLLQKHIPTAV